MKKIKSLLELSIICEKLKKEGKSVGLITGCFDVLHLGHIKFFQFAKKHVDFLIVGLDNDKTIKLSKGKDRPIFSEKERIQVLSKLEDVDYIFVIKGVVDFNSPKGGVVYREVTEKLKPTALITCPSADRFWREKQQRAKILRINLYADPRKRSRSSSKIVKILASEV